MAVLFAMAFAVCAVMATVAVDGVALYNERRAMQRAVDLAAIAAAADPGRATLTVGEVLAEAGLSGGGETVVTGRYHADPALSPGERFMPGGADINAVRVVLEREGRLHFANGWADPPTLSVAATAMTEPIAAFSVGSRLASLEGSIGNAVLNQLLGTGIALSVMDYNRLAGVEVEVLGFLDVLAQRLRIEAVSYDDLLAASATQGELAAALADSLEGADRLAALVLANAIGSSSAPVPLGRLFALGDLGALDIGGAPEGLTLGMSALDLVAAAAGLADGDRQVHLMLGAGVPGLLSLKLDLAVGEPLQGGSWYVVGDAGAVARTAQLRVRLVAGVAGIGALNGATVRLPLYLELAPSEALLAAARCPTRAAPSGGATLLVRPGLLRLAVGEVAEPNFGDFLRPLPVTPARMVEVKLLGLAVLRVLANAGIEVAATEPSALGFTSADIASGTLMTAATTTPVTSLAGALIARLVLDVPVLGLGLSLGALQGLLTTILSPVAPALDLTLTRVTDALGLGLGEADVRVHAVHCSHAVLVG